MSSGSLRSSAGAFCLTGSRRRLMQGLIERGNNGIVTPTGRKCFIETVRAPSIDLSGQRGLKRSLSAAIFILNAVYSWRHERSRRQNHELKPQVLSSEPIRRGRNLLRTAEQTRARSHPSSATILHPRISPPPATDRRRARPRRIYLSRHCYIHPLSPFPTMLDINTITPPSFLFVPGAE